ncbi:enoyl-CoA hydratase/isomerase family protein [Actinophytocola sp.]|uniref:enoyl-CoA hydratase/isomerase family protein n=1 Tax=Actinophytocola sp. TaxID=1872138 RepID=UPI003D6ADC6E
MWDVAELAGLPAAPARAELAPGVDDDGSVRHPVVMVDASSAHDAPDEVVSAAARRLRSASAVVVLVCPDTVRSELADAADVVLAVGSMDRRCVAVEDLDAAVERVRAAVAAAPRASLSLAWLLRGSATRDTTTGLLLESSVYSTLLAGPEFRTWLGRRGESRLAEPGDPAARVRVERHDDRLTIRLTRPERRNAVDVALRQGLVDALGLALALPGLAIELTGAGPAFCAGGDLDEFGSAPDPATAHLIRVLASPAAQLDRLRDRLTAVVHGACVGAGIELPAFAARVVARPDALFALPEIGMGLIPGAGGTVSIPRRIGRRRALWLAITGERITVRTALEWGLVDTVE